MHEDDEMRTQCFGGENMGEVFDHMSKRMNCRRQKRWWNAYILFYTRVDKTRPAPVLFLGQAATWSPT
jgi:ubiquitin carboxyl-terminal hydrolase 9/24